MRADFSLKLPLAVTLDLKCESRMLLEGLKQSHTGSKMINLRNYMVLRFRALYGSVFQGSDFYRFSLQKQNTLTGFHRLVRAMGDSLYYVNGCQQMAFTHRNITK